MWRDPMDELIADLEQVAPPEPSKFKFGGNPKDFVEVQKWTTRLLRRADDAYPDDVEQDDPEVQREVRNACRAMNRYVGRPEDWTPPTGPCSCRRCAPDTRSDGVDADGRHAVRSQVPPSS